MGVIADLWISPKTQTRLHQILKEVWDPEENLKQKPFNFSFWREVFWFIYSASCCPARSTGDSHTRVKPLCLVQQPTPHSLEELSQCGLQLLVTGFPSRGCVRDTLSPFQGWPVLQGSRLPYRGPRLRKCAAGHLRRCTACGRHLGHLPAHPSRSALSCRVWARLGTAASTLSSTHLRPLC